MAVWKWIVETAATWTAVGIWIRLLFSLAVGMFIGIDRGLKRRGAGIKTHVLVCLGSALVMLTSEYMFRTFPSAKADLARDGRAGYQRCRIFRGWHDHGNRASIRCVD